MRDDSHFESESATAVTTSQWRSRAATGVGAVMSLVILGAVVTWSYRLGVRDAADIPVIRAELAATKTRPDQPGGEIVAHQDRPVYGALGADGAEAPAPTGETFAPAPETLAEEDVAPIAAAPAPSPRPGVAPAARPTPAPNPLAADPSAADPSDDAAAGDATAGNSAAGNAAAPEATEAEQQQAALTPADEIDALVAEALSAGDGADAETDDRSVSAPRSAPKPATRPVRTARAATPPPEPREAARASAIQIQLGAFVTEEIAAREWDRIKDRNGDLLTGRGRVITPVQSGGRSLFRLRAGPFDTIDQASALCRGLSQRGAACIVARAE